MKYPNPDTTISTGADLIPIAPHTRTIWIQDIRNTIKQACRQWEYFTIDDINHMLNQQNIDTGNLGPHMAAMRSKGWITPTSTYIDNGNGPKKVWRSTCCEAVA